MILTNVVSYYHNTRFSAVSKYLEKKKKSISRKYVGLYGIHSVSVNNTDQKIKVIVHSMVKVPTKVKRNIINMAGKYSIAFIERKIKNHKDFHMEEIFESVKHK